MKFKTLFNPVFQHSKWMPIIFTMIILNVNAQQLPYLKGSVGLSSNVDLEHLQVPDYNTFLVKIKEAPNHVFELQEKKQLLFQERILNEAKNDLVKTKSAQQSTAIESRLEQGRSFVGNNSNGSPNDNSVAINDSGMIVSVVNTNLVIYNDTGKQLKFTSLGAFAGTAVVGNFPSISDPKVIFDPAAQRYILIFFTGRSSIDTRIILGFSKTSNPMGSWNFYWLDGCPKKDSSWVDYPIISLSKSDFFVTFNHLNENDVNWKTAFKYSAIWQIDKTKGYAGDSLKFNYWSDIKHQGRPIWNVCAVTQSGIPNSDTTYFVSVRPSDLSNDTVFLHTIYGSYKSGNATFNSRFLRTNLPYGLSPDAIQQDGQHLMTNDARVLHATLVNNKIFYVQNCKDFTRMRCGVYLGVYPLGANQIQGQIIGYDSLDLGYPSISMVGADQRDERCIINCSFVKKGSYAGVLALYKDKSNHIFAPLMLKYGTGNINATGDTIERWGDYTGIQQIYSNPNTLLISNSYAKNTISGTWISNIVCLDSLSTAKINTQQYSNTNLYPNPFENDLNLEFELDKKSWIDIQLFDIKGNHIQTFLHEIYGAGTYRYSMRTNDIPKGIYFLNIKNESGIISTKKIEKQ